MTARRPRLRVAPPGAGLPDNRARVARALLRPVATVLADQAHIMNAEAWAEIESDPRYLIGRLQQALTALLERDVPPMDATGRLLDEAIRDAMAYRRQTCAACGESVCDRCRPGWDKAAAYESLWRELGLIDDRRRPVRLTAVPR